MISKEEQERILCKYKLGEEEHNKLYEMIKRIWTDDKFPVDNPIAVVIGGQTGAGKSGIISYSRKMFDDGNVVVINSDEIKPFHPKSSEIAREYPDMYTSITDQESNTWTSRLFEETRNENYNIIFEGTMKNNRVADDAIQDLRKKGYTVIVRGLAVCDLESRLSILERYEAQVAHKGWGRLVVTDHHNQTYKGMPDTINYIEETGKYDVLEIFRRGKTPDTPEIIYGKINNETINKTKKCLESKKFVTVDNRTYGYTSAKDAILKEREEDYDRVIPKCKERFRIIKGYMDNRKTDQQLRISDEDSKNTDRNFIELMNYYNELKKKREQIKNNNVLINMEQDGDTRLMQDEQTNRKQEGEARD